MTRLNLLFDSKEFAGVFSAATSSVGKEAQPVDIARLEDAIAAERAGFASDDSDFARHYSSSVAEYANRWRSKTS
jgi:hypothetical protein